MVGNFRDVIFAAFWRCFGENVAKLDKEVSRLNAENARLLDERELKIALDATVDRLEESLVNQQQEIEDLWPLAKLGRWCLSASREEFADVDCFEIEELAIELGLLKMHPVTESCGEGCRCEDFPTMCYRETDLAQLAVDCPE